MGVGAWRTMHNSSKSLHFSNSVLALFDQYFSIPWWTIGTLNFITLWPSCHPLCLYLWGIVVSSSRLETSQICLHIFHSCEKLRYVRVLFGWPQFLDQRQTHRTHHEIPSPFQILPTKSRENSPPTFSKKPEPWNHGWNGATPVVS